VLCGFRALPLSPLRLRTGDGLPSCGSVFRGSTSGWLLRRRGVPHLTCAAAPDRAGELQVSNHTDDGGIVVLPAPAAAAAAGPLVQTLLVLVLSLLVSVGCSESGEAGSCFSILIDGGSCMGPRQCAGSRGRRVCRCHWYLHLVTWEWRTNHEMPAQARDFRVRARGLWADEWGLRTVLTN